jgi:hypothetical protein
MNGRELNNGRSLGIAHDYFTVATIHSKIVGARA